ncbi:MAG: hypothetical protein FJX77_06200, partial [Armatimonadetes bacterium]|nr:hypothetical protein [Armatimonadota bacterium]
MLPRIQSRFYLSMILSLLALPAGAEPPAPMLDTVFPAGGSAGSVVTVAVTGANLARPSRLVSNLPGLQCAPDGPNRFRLTLPGNVVPGQYDLWAVCENGLSSARAFRVSRRAEIVEKEAGEAGNGVEPVALNSVINGRIVAGGDQDTFRFPTRRGQRIVLECWSERIDSRLRAVLQIQDGSGRPLASNRGYHGVDPLLVFTAPTDGEYQVRVEDLISSGSPEHYYRLELNAGPHVAFAYPPVVERGRAARVTLFGWNLAAAAPARSVGTAMERVEVILPANLSRETWPLPVRLHPAQAGFQGFAYHHPGSQSAIPIGVTDVPVVRTEPTSTGTPTLTVLHAPCEATGRLGAGDRPDQYTLEARRGEVFYLEALGQRIQSPVDLQISILDESGRRELLQLGDELRNLGGRSFPSDHLDPAGRWVAPADGRFRIIVRNLTSGLNDDPRCLYRLSVRREEPEFQVVAIPRRDDPGGLTLRRGGVAAVDLIAFRKRGMVGGIRVAAHDLPTGIVCPAVWLGPGVDRAVLLVRAEENASTVPGELRLQATADSPEAMPAPVRAGGAVRAGLPNGWGRMLSRLPYLVAGEAALRIGANGHEPVEHHLYGSLTPRHSPGGALDVAVEIHRRERDHQAPVRLTAVGLPDEIRGQPLILPAGEAQGHLSFYLPPALPPGHYSLVIRAETTAPGPDRKPVTEVAYSEPVTFQVEPAAFQIAVDPYAPTRVKRGETIQIGYSALRKNGFIGKIHTELAAPGVVTNVRGLRARGETFVGGAEKGSLQVIINPDAPLGRHLFLRLFS